jgi:peptidoglycan hydrolase CwlO-like protein
MLEEFQMKVLRIIIGFILILAAILGLVFSIFGIISVNRYNSIISENLINNIDIIGSTLETTAQGLSDTQDSLSAATVALVSLQNTISTTADTISASEPMLDSLGKLLDEDLPNTISTTQTSFETAQESAKVIDSVLKAVSFFPGINYDPEIPLHEALADVSESLGGIPESLAEMNDSIEDTSHNLQVIQVDLILMKDTIRQIENSLSSSEDVLEQYQKTISSIQTQISDLQERIPNIINSVSILVYIFLGWMAAAQIGLLTQGWELITRNKKQS